MDSKKNNDLLESLKPIVKKLKEPVLSDLLVILLAYENKKNLEPLKYEDFFNRKCSRDGENNTSIAIGIIKTLNIFSAFSFIKFHYVNNKKAILSIDFINEELLEVLKLYIPNEEDLSNGVSYECLNEDEEYENEEMIRLSYIMYFKVVYEFYGHIFY